MKFMSLTDEPPAIKVHRPSPTVAIHPVVTPQATTGPLTVPAPSEPIVNHSDPHWIDHVLLPRYVIFMQGFLLLVVGALCFLLGYAVGGSGKASSPRTMNAAPNGITISGTVSLRRQGLRAADVGAALLFIPWDVQPTSKSNLEGFLPDDDSSTRSKADEWLKSLGGNFVRCNERGEYEVTLPAVGRYGVLILSGTASQKLNGALVTQEREQMNRYFDLSDDPLQNLRYQWRSETIRGGTTLNVDFD
jgi:hypothetical protein